MKQEIERKFLVQGTAWKNASAGYLCRQGYLLRSREYVVRIRTTGSKGYLAVKGASAGISRMEYEYEIPFTEACDMLEKFCEKPLIEKYRYPIQYKGLIWEVDEFFLENEGLLIAEVELESETQVFEKPEWAGEEVTGDARYYNSNLARHPYRKWSAK
ncbi:MAG: CYTH domain-containing protein [Thermodesulfobacteriota bacterium]